MSSETLLILALIFGFYAAWNIGANDVANAMGTSVGSKALTLRQAVVLAAIFEFLGAILFGSHVLSTIEHGLIVPEVFANSPLTLITGMLSALLATGLWLQFASYCGLPVSTTHSIVGAIVGFGAVVGGIDAIQWDTVFSIAVSWIASPLLGAAASYFVFHIIRQQIFYSFSPLQALKKRLPFLVGAVMLVLSLSMLSHVLLPHHPIAIKLLIAMLFSATVAFISYFLSRRLQIPTHKRKEVSTIDPQALTDLEKAKRHLLHIQNSAHGEQRFQLADIIQDIDNFSFALKRDASTEKKQGEFYWVEKIFGWLQISSACLMAFAHGSNDVSNAIGPMVAIIDALKHSFSENSSIPMWALVLGGSGIVIGLATWGWRVIETIGRRITELTPSRGFSAEFGAALTILLASRLGFPISTTHTLVGAVFGVGLAGGLAALNAKTLRDILLSWIVTIPAGAILAIICYYALSTIFHYF